LPICSALRCLWFSHSPYAHIRMTTPHTVLQAPERLISGLPALCVRTTLSVLRGLLLRGEFCASLPWHLFHAASVLVWSCGCADFLARVFAWKRHSVRTAHSANTHVWGLSFAQGAGIVVRVPQPQTSHHTRIRVFGELRQPARSHTQCKQARPRKACRRIKATADFFGQPVLFTWIQRPRLFLHACACGLGRVGGWVSEWVGWEVVRHKMASTHYARRKAQL
jgi:hypothetical protein